ncbi:NAD-dependent epimerase/dehydratase family protein [Streptomyces ipomoeae]|uniref:NAD-dependent epimerase/dehydratase family protein n=1 Tax=Streptomyces ipomoeae TaxID=103232 RepID=A0AAE8W962_9ACTN|nr:SDR family oxidoreductase [Streptomyces ipomoeae]TQE35747.1 NAD-dependent epimerase/dehydratase family protein [Streptomyces ipomoeae]TQE38997.1 NAD-dependent epimerase/dehydratase family protein [Streptomyces ipomoeae]
MSARRTVLLTGASGVVGRSILRERTPAGPRIIAAAHSAPVPEAEEPPVALDLTAERLGLDADSHAALAAEVDVVIHSAGLTEWGLPAERYEPINVEGTRRVLEFAEQAGATVHFMSTAFVAALAPDAPVPLGERNVVHHYIRSKLRAERLLADSGLPHTVFRPTNLIGDSRTGWTSQGQIVQLMSDWIGRGRAPFVPAHPGIRMDFVSQDLLSRAVLRAIELGDDRGEFWVTYGEEAMDVETCLELLVKHAAGRGRQLTAPPVVNADDLDPDAIARTAPMTRSYLSVLRDVSEVTRCSGGVLPTSMPELRERYGIPRVDDTAAYLTGLEYAAEHFG